MRIGVRLQQPWGDFKTKKLMIDKENSVIEIKQMIQDQFQIPIQKQILKVKRDGITIRIIEGWDLEFYEIKDSTLIYVYNLCHREFTKQQIEQQVNRRYLQKLGIKTIIEEEDDDQESNQIQENNISKSILNLPLNIQQMVQKKKVERKESDTDYEDDEYLTEDLILLKKHLEIQLDFLIQITKESNLQKIQEFFEDINTLDIPQNIKERYLRKKKRLMSSIGVQGWSSIHYAVYQGDVDIVDEFIKRNGNFNKLTFDGWSPLQLAIHKNRTHTVKLLMTYDKVQINLITPKGTALHLASKQNKLKMVQILLKSNADPKLKDQNGYLASDYCQNDDVIKEFTDYQNEIDEIEKQKLQKEQIKVQKPPKIMGYLYKVGQFHINITKRFFVLDPTQGTLIIYKQKEDYPIKNYIVIPLTNIFSLKIQQKSWYMTKHLLYFEIQFSSRLILGCKQQSTLNIWIQSILQASVYSHYQESEYRENINNFDLITSLKYDANEIAIEVIDDTKQMFDRPKILQDIITNKITKEEYLIQDHIYKKPKEPLHHYESPKIQPLQGIQITQNYLTDSPQQFIRSESQQQSTLDSIPNLDLDGEEQQQNTQIKKFKDFQIIRILGSGSFGKVFLVNVILNDI